MLAWPNWVGKVCEMDKESVQLWLSSLCPSRRRASRNLAGNKTVQTIFLPMCWCWCGLGWSHTWSAQAHFRSLHKVCLLPKNERRRIDSQFCNAGSFKVADCTVSSKRCLLWYVSAIHSQDIDNQRICISNLIGFPFWKLGVRGPCSLTTGFIIVNKRKKSKSFA